MVPAGLRPVRPAWGERSSGRLREERRGFFMQSCALTLSALSPSAPHSATKQNGHALRSAVIHATASRYWRPSRKIKGRKGSEAYRTLEVEGPTPFGSTFLSTTQRTALLVVSDNCPRLSEIVRDSRTSDTTRVVFG